EILVGEEGEAVLRGEEAAGELASEEMGGDGGIPERCGARRERLFVDAHAEVSARQQPGDLVGLGGGAAGDEGGDPPLLPAPEPLCQRGEVASLRLDLLADPRGVLQVEADRLLPPAAQP